MTETPETWNEEQYEASLAHLEALQDQLMALRATIPSLIRPLTRPNTTKVEAFNGAKKAAVTAVTDVKSFRSQWGSQQTQQILMRAKDSESKDRDLSAGKDIPVYGWTDGYSGTPAVLVNVKEEQVVDTAASSPERPLKLEREGLSESAVPAPETASVQPAANDESKAKKLLFKRPDWAQDLSLGTATSDMFGNARNT